MEQWNRICESYEVSTLGNVRSLDKVITRNGKDARIKGKALSPNVGKTGYLSVQIGRGKRKYIHRLVAEAFIGFDDVFLEVNHKNGIKADNRLANIEVVTHSQNIKHSFNVLGRVPPWLGKSGAKNPRSKPVVGKNVITGHVVSYGSCGEAGRNGFDFSEVAKCCRGEVKAHKSFVWSWVA